MTTWGPTAKIRTSAPRSGLRSPSPAAWRRVGRSDGCGRGLDRHDQDFGGYDRCSRRWRRGRPRHRDRTQLEAWERQVLLDNTLASQPLTSSPLHILDIQWDCRLAAFEAVDRRLDVVAEALSNPADRSERPPHIPRGRGRRIRPRFDRQGSGGTRRVRSSCQWPWSLSPSWNPRDSHHTPSAGRREGKTQLDSPNEFIQWARSSRPARRNLPAAPRGPLAPRARCGSCGSAWGRRGAP